MKRMAWVLALGWAGFAWAADPLLTLDTRDGRILTYPRVAFNTTDPRYLAVWEYHYATAGDWDIDGCVVEANGRPMGQPFGIAWKGSIEQEEPDVVYNPVTDEFLVVYALSPGNWNISGCRVAGDGTPGEFIPIADRPVPEVHPAVACDPVTGEYLVLYEGKHQLDSFEWRDVWAQRLSADGVRIGDPYTLSDPSEDSRQCAIAGAGGQFLAVWQEQTGGKGRILGRIIQCGYPSKTTLVIASAKDSSNPQVAYNPARAEYLVVYQDRTNSTARWILEGTRVSTLGEVKATYSITKATSTNEHCQAPDVAYDRATGLYLVIWAQGPTFVHPSLASHRIWAQCVAGDGKPLGDARAVSGPGKSQPLNPGIPAPAVAVGFCSKALIVWEDQSVGLNPGGPSTTIYSILGAPGTGCGSCGEPNDVFLSD